MANCECPGMDIPVEFDSFVETSVTDHDKLNNLDLPDQHPMSAITGLESALGDKVDLDQGIENADKYLMVGSDGIVIPVEGDTAEIYMRVNDGYIQYSSDNETWENLIAVADLKGDKGDPGNPGQDGQDGHSPVITASKSGKVTTISVDGTAIATIDDGADGQDGAPGQDGQDGAPGQDGQDGFSPTVSITDITGGHRVSVTDVSGTDTFDVMDGADGQDGQDGVSPSVSVSSITGGHEIEITDASGTSSFDVMDGVDGQDGQDGADGHSPVVTASKSGTTTTISVDGTAIATIDDGADGQDGADGHSPVVTASKSGSVTTISVDGTSIATINDGQDGYTPVKGTDYWTAQDQASIVSDVLAALPTWSGGNY